MRVAFCIVSAAFFAGAAIPTGRMRSTPHLLKPKSKRKNGFFILRSNAQAAAPGCPHLSAKLDCAAISANADVEQAREAAYQTWWFKWEVGVTFLTLLTAFGAMVYAKRASEAAHGNFFRTKRKEPGNDARGLASIHSRLGSFPVAGILMGWLCRAFSYGQHSHDKHGAKSRYRCPHGDPAQGH